MNISLNGQIHQTSASNLNELLAEIDLSDAVVATALNGEFVSADMREETTLSAGDQIEVLAPMQGG
ncbi:sulfur carrier protein [Paenochrobactrum gallinarii]|uniref:Sulfur carrier protein n=1 Tax=Paenochrobactrum gallinarii TaxID=643673 RepID=A0A841LUF5_9HYPH|nr:sulfur carrier protein ThiS [Paenochrobactrum gallinarii]MBB6261743.1 sulfur carrier protein [Paenochrobactrum gallinarii]